MAEIKSTLDLILEKTQNMTLSEEEKNEIRQQELSGKIKGWIRKYENALLNLKTIQSEIEKDDVARQIELKEALQKEVLHLIEPDKDNSRFLQLLEEICDTGTEVIVNMIQQFQNTIAAERAIIHKELNLRLEENGISGTAVIPSLYSDAEWNTRYDQSTEAFKKQIRLIAGN
jgi:ribosomal protein S20